MKPWEKYATLNQLNNEAPGPWQNHQANDMPWGDYLQTEASKPEYIPTNEHPFLVGMGRGFTEVFDGAAQAALLGAESIGMPLMDPENRREWQAEVEEDSRLYDKYQEYDENQLTGKIGRFTGNALPFTVFPAAASTMGGRMALGATGGAIAGGTVYQEGADDLLDGDRISNTALGAGIGAVAVPVTEKLAITAIPVIRALLGRTTNGVQASNKLLSKGEITPELQEALSVNGMTIDDLTGTTKQALEDVPQGLDAKESLAAAELKALDVQPTTAQITGKFDDYQAQNAMLESTGPGGDAVRDALETQQSQVFNKLDETVEAMGGKELDNYDLGETIKAPLKSRKAKQETEIDKLYETIKASHGDESVSVIHLLNVLDDVEDFSGQVPGIDTVTKRLKRFGVIDENGKVIGDLSVKQAELLRRDITKATTGTGTGDHIGRQLREALDEDVADTLGQDVFSTARAAYKTNLKEFVSKDTAGKVRDIVEDNIASEDIIKAVTGQRWKAKDIAQVKESLLKSFEGEKAWADLRSSTVRWIANQAKAGQKINSKGEPVLSGANMRKAIRDKLGVAKMRALFSEEERNQIMIILRTAETITKIPEGSKNYSGTGARLINWLNGKVEALPFARIFLQELKAIGETGKASKIIEGEKALIKEHQKKANKEAAEKLLLPGSVGGATEQGRQEVFRPSQ